MKRAAHPPSRRQSGFGLVELLVALAVSALLLTGIFEIFLGSRQSYRLVAAQAQLQESGRFATAILHRELRLAGYPFTDPQMGVWGIYTTGGLTGDDVGGAGGGNNSDTLTVMYQTNPLGTLGATVPTGDCMGNTTDYDGDGGAEYPPAGMTFPNGYQGADFYAKNRYLVLPSGHLACLPYDVGDNPRLHGSCTLAALGADPIINTDCEEHILVEGVDSLQILYGVDGDTPTNGIANRFENAAQVTAAGTWDRVVSVRLELLVNSGDHQGLDSADTTTTYALLDAPTLGPFNDRLSRDVFSTTIALRNRTRISR